MPRLLMLHSHPPPPLPPLPRFVFDMLFLSHDGDDDDNCRGGDGGDVAVGYLNETEPLFQQLQDGVLQKT